MNNITLEEIAKNVSGNIVLFPPASNGIVKFEVKDKFQTINDKISFSAVVSLQQKDYYDKVAHLELIKYNNKTKKYSIFLLKKISLRNGLSNPTLIRSVVDIDPDQSLGDGFPMRNNFTFNFEDIPVLGPGKYAIALVLDEGNTFESIASFYFEVIE